MTLTVSTRICVGVCAWVSTNSTDWEIKYTLHCTYKAPVDPELVILHPLFRVKLLPQIRHSIAHIFAYVFGDHLPFLKRMIGKQPPSMYARTSYTNHTFKRGAGNDAFLGIQLSCITTSQSCTLRQARGCHSRSRRIDSSFEVAAQ